MQENSRVLAAWKGYRQHFDCSSTLSKTRNILSALYEYAIRYGWATADPIKQARPNAKRLSEPDVLMFEEISPLTGDEPPVYRVEVKVTQDILGPANSRIMMDIYTQAVGLRLKGSQRKTDRHADGKQPGPSPVSCRNGW
jgi:site-specific recombinase XerD